MNWDPNDGVLAALGLKLGNCIAGILSSVAGLRFFDELSTIDRWLTLIGAWTLSVWGGPALGVYLNVPPKSEIGIVIMMGFFGMATASKLISLMRSLDWSLLKDIFLRK